MASTFFLKRGHRILAAVTFWTRLSVGPDIILIASLVERRVYFIDSYMVSMKTNYRKKRQNARWPSMCLSQATTHEGTDGNIYFIRKSEAHDAV